MKSVFITDQSTNLNKELLNQYNILLIKNAKSLRGQIIYELDQILNANFNIIYLADDNIYDFVNSISDKLISFHEHQEIKVININSELIGKNNLSLRLVNAKNIDFIINQYNLKQQTHNGEPLLTIDSSIAFNI